MQKGQTGIFLLVFIPFVLVIAGGAYYLGRQSSNPESPATKACTEEAKLCPDGSAVGRIGPNCEFTECPQPPSTSNDETPNWKTYISEKFNYQFQHPNLLLNQCNVGGIEEADILDVVISQGQPIQGTEHCGIYTISVFNFPMVVKSIPEKLENFVAFQTEQGGIYGGKREDYIQTETKIGNIPATKLTSKTSPGFAIYAFSQKYTGYYILINDTTKGFSSEEIDHILLTFKFTN